MISFQYNIPQNLAFPKPSLATRAFFWHDDIIKWKHFPPYGPFTKASGAKRWYIFFICALDKRMSKQQWGWWFETPSRPLWRQRLVLQQDVITFLGSLLIEMKHFLQKMLIYFDIEVVGNEALVNTDQMMHHWVFQRWYLKQVRLIDFHKFPTFTVYNSKTRWECDIVLGSSSLTRSLKT